VAGAVAGAGAAERGEGLPGVARRASRRAGRSERGHQLPQRIPLQRHDPLPGVDDAL